MDTEARCDLEIDVEPRTLSRFYEEVVRGRAVYRQYSSARWPLTDSPARKAILLTRRRCVSRSILTRDGDIEFKRCDLDERMRSRAFNLRDFRRLSVFIDTALVT